MVRPTKRRENIEIPWVSWYTKKHYPTEELSLRCPLGPIPDDMKRRHGPAKAARIYRPSRPEVDGLIVLPGAILLIEAKVTKYREGLGALVVYESLINETPELQPLLPRPVLKHLLLCQPIPWVVVSARKLGIEIMIDAPDFVIDYWSRQNRYWTAEARIIREEWKALLNKLGR